MTQKPKLTMTEAQSPREQILTALKVVRFFDAETELERRVEFLARYLVANQRSSYVLGISGGVDSLVAGTLAQRAVTRLRNEGKPARFIAVRLPYGTQKDEADAARCIDFIAPDELQTIDIQPAVAALRAQLIAGGLKFGDAAAEDFHVGNIKARTRMVAQYAIAGATGGLVIGTDHAAEALMGFFTKHGDGAADVLPLAGLSKRRVRAVGTALGAPEALVMKTPTADLETLRPLRADEDAFGVSYQVIDDFLEGLPVAPEAEQIILSTYARSAHKREPAATPA